MQIKLQGKIMKIKNIKVNRIKTPQEDNARPFVGRPGQLVLQI